MPVRRSIRPHHLLLLSAVTLGVAGSHVLESRPRQILEESTRQRPSLDASTARASAVLEGLPLAFEPAGAGQDHFVVRAGAAKADIRHNGLTILQGAEASSRIDITFGGANVRGRLVPEDRLPGRVHYLRGNKREDWRVDVPRFARVRGRDIYPGIDVEYYGTRQHLEYDFIVSAGADPGSIELRVAAGEPVTITRDGELALARGGVIQKKPVAFQTVAGARRGVDASYVQRAAGKFAIQVGAYDPAIPLVIDPVVVYAFTQVAPGGVMDMVTDATGALYLAGTAFWAFGGGGTACSPIPCTDGFVYKLNRAGTDLEFATLLVGSAQDSLSRIALDGAGNIHVAGVTTSNDFPGTTQPGIVVARLAPDGSQVLNTHVEEIPSHFVFNRVVDLAVSSSGEAYAWVGRAFFPNTDCSNAVLLRVPLAGPAAAIDGATHCAGLPSDGFAVAVGPDDHVYISVIRVSSISLPLQGAFIRARADGTTVYSTTQDWANAIAIAPNGDALNGRVHRLRSIGPTGDLRFEATLPIDFRQWPESRLAHIGVDAAGTILAVACGRWQTPTPGSACAAFHFDQSGTMIKSELLDEEYDSVFTSDARGMLYAAKGSFTIRKYSFATAAFVSPPATASAGTPITWQATTSLTGSVEYAFYKHTAATGWVLVQPFSASNSHTWTPAIGDIGTHNLQVFVRQTGSPHPYETWRGTQVQIVAPPTTVNAFVASTPTGLTGAPVTFSATASGGVGPLQYQFWRLQGGTWQIVQPYSTSATFLWTPGPADAGTHSLQVWVRNAGSTATFDAWRGLSFTVDTPPPPAIQALVASPSAVPIGGTVTFTATASGIAPLQYRFWRLDSDGWKLAQDYGPSPSYSWTPGAGDVGAHAVQVWVRNSGSTAIYDAWRSVDFSVVAPPPVTITSVARSVASPAQAGSPITWTTTASGGVGTLHYQFWRLDADGWKLAQAYSPTNTYTWTPGASDVGEHVLQVWVREAGSAATYEAWRGDPFSVVHAPVTTPVLSATANAPFQSGQTVTWTAASTGGSGPLEYQFWRLDAGTWTMVQGYSSSASFAWTIGAADVGTHALQVFVRSTGAALPYQAWSGTGTFVVNP